MILLALILIAVIIVLVIALVTSNGGRAGLEQSNLLLKDKVAKLKKEIQDLHKEKNILADALVDAEIKYNKL